MPARSGNVRGAAYLDTPVVLIGDLWACHEPRILPPPRATGDVPMLGAAGTYLGEPTAALASASAGWNVRYVGRQARGSIWSGDGGAR